MIDDNRIFAQSFTRIATYKINGDFVEKTIKYKNWITEWMENPSSIENDTITEEIKEYLRQWSEIGELFTEAISSNPNFRSFQIVVPSGDDVFCLWGLENEGQIIVVKGFINSVLSSVNCSPKTINKISLAVEELFGNITMYAYADSGTGTATVRLRITKNPYEAVITFMDSGRPFDPMAKKDPNVKLEASKRKQGGLGIFISKKFMDDIRYEYKDGRNILTIVKRLEE